VPATNGCKPSPGGGHNSHAGAALAPIALAADALPRATGAEVRSEPIPPVVDAVVLDRPLGVDAADRVGVAGKPAPPDWFTVVVPAAPAVVWDVMEVVEFAAVVLDGVAVVAVEPVGVAAVCAAAGTGNATPSSAIRHAAPR
jgi:hypothetical protein